MKSYWKMVLAALVAVALMSPLLVPTPGTWLLAPLAVAVSGYVGFRLVPRVDELAHGRPHVVIAVILLSAAAIGTGAAMHLTAVWSLGLGGMLAFPFARMAKDCKEDELVMARMLG